jgi:hypothetical protein
MVTVEQLSENSRQGFDVQKQSRIGLESDLSRNLCWGCGHVYDETPVDIAVYVRNDPVNLVDPDGMDPDDPGTWIFGGASDYMIWSDGGEYIATTTVFAFGFSEKGIKTKVLHQPFPTLCNNTDAVGFVKDHQSDAAKVAKELGIPTYLLLGLSARESGYGSGPFVEGNAFFSLQVRSEEKPNYLLSFSNGWMQAKKDSGIWVATYANYLDSAKGFAEKFGDVVRDTQDPKTFLEALKEAKFNTFPEFLIPTVLNQVKIRMNCP